jgi:hypothetical protein
MLQSVTAEEVCQSPRELILLAWEHLNFRLFQAAISWHSNPTVCMPLKFPSTLLHSVPRPFFTTSSISYHHPSLTLHSPRINASAASALAHCSQMLALALAMRVSELYAVDIHPAAVVGRGVMLDHALGVFIGATAVGWSHEQAGSFVEGCVWPLGDQSRAFGLEPQHTVAVGIAVWH